MSGGIGRTQSSHAIIERYTHTERHKTIPTVTNKDSEFGRPIPTEVQVDALELLVEEWGCPTAAADSVIREAAGALELDLPDMAIRSLMTLVDLTGAYRVIAMLAAAS